MPTTGVSASAPSSARTSERIARGEEVVGRDCVVQYGEAFGRNALLHEVTFYGVGDGEQMGLMAMPNGGGETLHVADRGWAAEAFEPAAPPTCGGKRGLNDFGAVLTGDLRDERDRQRVDFAGDSACLRLDAEAVHFGDGGATGFDQRGHGVAAGFHVRCHADELHLGAAHARGRDDLEHAAWGSALGGIAGASN